ncbi:LysR family transcriptional regulator [Phytomonospora endophytica]|uniref:DNA-binding transcriptional LysR family regulator n=1 Tax=Phytomonospora endophytica TaxID=714109 RepID=A0A841FXH7_9ACTN|nr:LysR family transcriptional regulator [Phytomonospora endophytica]MBB6038438.1 DNA-binding transcriptional LysR family regulator [Phytomonospora endophytica]GIG64367.1 LysR family transcriptional regulator [Phytomonospora endophytica]
MLNLTHLRVLESVARHGSVTRAAKELHYSQPSVSHHLGRLETATGAKLVQRVGRGIRLTPEGELLALRATEILGRLNAASTELAARVGLRAGRVRVAGFQTVLSTLVPKAAVELARRHPGVELNLVDAHPAEGLRMLRSGHVDVALIFRGAGDPVEEDGVRLVHLLDDPLYLVADRPDQRLEDHRDSAWVGGCERCLAATVSACERAGFVPRVAYFCDDTVVTQSLVAAGVGVAIVNGLALRAHRAPGVHATALPEEPRRIYAATYGEPPDPPATTALLEILASARVG